MANDLIIESRDPWESRDVDFVVSLASDLARAQHQVTLFLVQNGVLATRRGDAGAR
jgi:sulfur relay (sulfurtransferase) complex TusBCD TusD component (DsrE family)